MLGIRKIGVITKTYRNLHRYRQILTVFFRYGFGDLIEMLKIDQYLEIGIQMISKKPRTRVAKLTRAARIRMALEELGPAFIKLGQTLSTRPDLIPMEFLNEFSKLQDEVPACSYDEIKKIIDSEFSYKFSKLFKFFDKIPIASASIGQVHKAKLIDGDDVAVKVQRPGIKKIVEIDLEIMFHLATLTERHLEEIRIYRPIKIVEEFARTIEKELDYTIEASHLERFAFQFIDDPTIYVPKVYMEATTSKILTMEFIDGIKVSDISSLENAGLDRKKITARGGDLMFKQIFNHGFFHADPHPGNIFILPNNVICMLDFGMMGSINRKTRENFIDLIESVLKRNPAGATMVILRLTMYDEQPDLRFLERDVGDFMSQHLYKPLKNIEIGKLFQHLMQLVLHHRLYIPSDLFLVMKSLATIEGVGVFLDPDFDMIQQAIPFITHVKLARLHPKRITEDIINFSSDFLKIPQNFQEILLMMQQGKLKVGFEHKGIEPILITHDRTVNRLCFSIIIAALIIGSALIVFAKTPPFFFGISFIGIVGFIAAALMGIWLILGMLKGGKL
ncbi:ubiquinone biosynthesis protein [Candidatus Magnetomoraceae bacterium gMMP-15]